jgi:hypothetical protein
MSNVFTPMNADLTHRLSFPVNKVKTVSGNPINQTGPGLHGIIELCNGQRFEVYGLDCGCACYCDAYIVPI